MARTICLIRFAHSSVRQSLSLNITPRFLSIFVGFKEAVFLFKRSHNKAVTRQVPVVLGCQRRVAYSTQTKDVSRIDNNSYLATLERSLRVRQP